MLTHPDTAGQVARCDYADRLRAGARARLAQQVAGARHPGGALRAVREIAGAALVAVGQRLHGARPAAQTIDGPEAAVEPGAAS